MTSGERTELDRQIVEDLAGPLTLAIIDGLVLGVGAKRYIVAELDGQRFAVLVVSSDCTETRACSKSGRRTLVGTPIIT